jgi:D-alanyl-D-alanine carboxypeptidase
VQGRFPRLAAAVVILAVIVVAVVKLGEGNGGSQPASAPAGQAATSILEAAPGSAGEPATSEPEQARSLSAAPASGGDVATTDGEHLYAPDARTHKLARRMTARAFVAVDADTGEVLIAHREHRRLPIASLTKMMTGLLVAEAGKLAEQVLVTPWATHVEPNRDGLLAGHTYARKTLLYSTLLASNNDAAEALGVDLAGTAANFYAAMNLRAEELGLTETRYASASGLEDLRNTSTALDQATLLRAALGNPTFVKVSGTWRARLPWEPPTHVKVYENHNKMLRSYPGTFAGKTGWTTRAKGCLAVAVERDGKRIVAVVLGADDIWKDMPLLVDTALARAAKAAA